MKVLVIDAQGGGIGKQVVAAIKHKQPENAVVVGCRTADVIIGPIGIVIADAMFGEVTPTMAVAVGQSRAKRLLIPVNHCDNTIVGVSHLSVGNLIEEVLKEI